MNYYHILEVSDGASELDIKRAFRMKLKRLHPDSSAFHEENNSQTEGTFHDEHSLVEVITAYTVLSNPVKRRYYDACIERQYYRCTTSSRAHKKKTFDYEQFLSVDSTCLSTKRNFSFMT